MAQQSRTPGPMDSGNRHNQGWLIALEGIDGAGTTTQIERLSAYIQSLGWRVQTTAEPSKGPVGLLLRQALRGAPSMDEATLALLFAADRLDHGRRQILPALAAGEVVLTDRYILSSYAYQATHLPLAWVQTIGSYARPADATLFLRVSPATAARRRHSRGDAAEHFDALTRQTQVAQLYEQAIALPGIGCVRVVDAEADRDQVTLACQAHLRALLQPSCAP